MTVFKTFWIKLTHWEHWPTPLIYLPVFIYYSWLSIKSCDFFFFTAANPGMEMGGLYNTSKFRQLHYLPKRLIPKTIIFDPFSTLEEISKSLRINQLTFPLVCKPDRGERGKGVALINDLNELETYLVSCTTEFLVQEFIDYPLEAGVFFYKYPDQNSGVIPSLVLKEFLSVKGDGISTIDTLLKSKPRALLVATSLRKSLGRRLEEIPALDEEVIVEPIGNHNRGTAFISGNIDIDDELLATFNKISSYLPSFYYGRFDVKSKSLHDLKSGMNTKILEVNGVNAEPAHIYDPNTCLFQGITTLFRHWNIIYEIAKQNRKKGVKTVNLSRAWNHFVNWKKNK